MPEQFYDAATYQPRDSVGYLVRRLYSIMRTRLEAAFAAVLARRPGDEMAEAGLARVAARRSGPLRAADLLASDEAPAGLTGRKIQLLQRYLQRIREGAKRHVS